MPGPDGDVNLTPRREHLGKLSVNLVDAGPREGGSPGLAGRGAVGPLKDEALVFVHGITATHAYWRQNLPHFARRRRVLALDLPGFGRSDRPDMDYAMHEFVELLRELLDTRGIQRATLIGNSMGGLISMLFSLTHPTRTERLVLVNPAGVSLWPRRFMSWGLALGRLGVRGAQLGFGGSDARPVGLPRIRPIMVTALFRAVFPRSPEIADRYTRSYVRAIESDDYPLYLRAAVRAARSIVSSPMRERCREIAAPTLIVWGARDRLVPVSDGKLLRQRVAGSRLLIYSKSGHCPMIDQAERFNHDVEGFLDGRVIGR